MRVEREPSLGLQLGGRKMKKSLAILLVTGAMLGGLTGTADAGGNWAISATWVSGHAVMTHPQPVAYRPPVVVHPRPVICRPPVAYHPPVIYRPPVVCHQPVITAGFGYNGRGHTQYTPQREHYGQPATHGGGRGGSGNRRR